MASKDYIYSGRKKYARPQAMLWSENSGTLVNGFFVPEGVEVGSVSTATPEFLILSDDNRSDIQFTPQRIEQRKRMVNGRMRSYHVADKMTLSTSWSMLPSRSSGSRPDFDINGVTLNEMYTSDGGAGGNEILDWYENHKGSFWVYLAYDKYTEFGKDDAAYNHLGQYTQVIEMYISNFSYTVKQRGANNMDLWDISISLEEA